MLIFVFNNIPDNFHKLLPKRSTEVTSRQRADFTQNLICEANHIIFPHRDENTLTGTEPRLKSVTTLLCSIALINVL